MTKFNKYINELLAEGDLNKMRSFICRNANTCEECPLKNDDCKDNSVLKEFFYGTQEQRS